REVFLSVGVDFGDSFEVSIMKNNSQIVKYTMYYVRSLAYSHLCVTLLFLFSVDFIVIVIINGLFAKSYYSRKGINMKIEIKKTTNNNQDQYALFTENITFKV